MIWEILHRIWRAWRIFTGLIKSTDVDIDYWSWALRHSIFCVTFNSHHQLEIWVSKAGYTERDRKYPKEMIELPTYMDKYNINPQTIQIGEKC